MTGVVLKTQAAPVGGAWTSARLRRVTCPRLILPLHSDMIQLLIKVQQAEAGLTLSHSTGRR